MSDGLERRRWDLLDLLLDWGADARTADTWRILDTYQRSVFDRFQAAGVDLSSDDAMAKGRHWSGVVTVQSETRNQRGEVVQTTTVKPLVPRRSTIHAAR